MNEGDWTEYIWNLVIFRKSLILNAETQKTIIYIFPQYNYHYKYWAATAEDTAEQVSFQAIYVRYYMFWQVNR